MKQATNEVSEDLPFFTSEIVHLTYLKGLEIPKLKEGNVPQLKKNPPIGRVKFS